MSIFVHFLLGTNPSFIVVFASTILITDHKSSGKKYWWPFIFLAGWAALPLKGQHSCWGMLTGQWRNPSQEPGFSFFFLIFFFFKLNYLIMVSGYKSKMVTAVSWLGACDKKTHTYLKGIWIKLINEWKFQLNWMYWVITLTVSLQLPKGGGKMYFMKCRTSRDLHSFCTQAGAPSRWTAAESENLTLWTATAVLHKGI